MAGRNGSSLCKKITQGVVETIFYIPKRAAECIGKRWISKILGSRLQAIVKIDGISFSVFGPQRLKGIHISNATGEVSIEELQVGTPFHSLFSISEKAVQIGNGTFSSSIYGQGKIARAAGNISPDSLTLSEPLCLTWEPCRDEEIKNLNPLFSEGVELKNPLSVTIFPKNSFCPLHSLEKMQIGDAVLDIGKIECKNGQLFSSLVNYLKPKGFLDKPIIEVHCSSVAFSFKEGIFNFGRMDAMLDRSVHVCTWGTVDLLADRIGMQAGIPSATIEKFLGIQGLSPDFVLQIPITGTSKEPQLEIVQTGIKIASLAVGKISGDGAVGGWLKSWLLAPEAREVPPAKKPFPWEYNY